MGKAVKTTLLISALTVLPFFFLNSSRLTWRNKRNVPPPPPPPQLGGAVPCLDKGTQQEQYCNIYKSLRENQSVDR